MPGILSKNRDSDDSQSTGSDSDSSEPGNDNQRLRQHSLPPQTPSQSPSQSPPQFPPQSPQPAAIHQRSRNVARRGRRFVGPR